MDFIDKTINSLSIGINIITELFLGIIALWPFVILTPIIIYFYRKRKRTNKNRKKDNLKA